jgi:hypothetical protein
MRTPFRFILLLLAPGLWLVFADARLGLVVEAGFPLHQTVFDSLVLELAYLLAPAGITPVVQLAEPVNHFGSVDAAITVYLRGVCEVPMAATPVTGALGWIPMMDGEFLSLVWIDCDGAANHIASVFTAHHYALARPLLGRALARILVHELMHWSTGSAEHGNTPLFSASVTPYTLIESGVGLEPADIAAVQAGVARRVLAAVPD